MSDTDVSPGDTYTYSRTFTRDDVERFTEISNDQGEHHLETDERGRVVVHGLLTATLPTKLGGDLDYLARDMVFEFRKPVYTDEEISCELTVLDVADRDGGIDLSAEAICTNEDDEVVMTGEFEGVIFE
ncbi:FAS1-like dehydratase domain-containing protein [Halomarina pelagica]|uniref:FAS1-like dehydratase domain-containing protein n=1 Tax=Halomarina pelagica TaxID=2961599 RepID=UPI0020C265C9|nr:MaoC family dehydratase N-terminal domain-containing protein [Halomarina sp. BND7]